MLPIEKKKEKRKKSNTKDERVRRGKRNEVGPCVGLLINEPCMHGLDKNDLKGVDSKVSTHV